MWSDVAVSFSGMNPCDSLLERARTRAHELAQACSGTPRIRVYIGSRPGQEQKGHYYAVRVYLTLVGEKGLEGKTLEGNGRGRDSMEALERAFKHVRALFDHLRPCEDAHRWAPYRHRVEHGSRAFRYRHAGATVPTKKVTIPPGTGNSNKGTADGQAA
jgi:hypothetical protein